MTEKTDNVWGYRADRIGHWYEGPETFVIVRAGDLPLGVQTYGPPGDDWKPIETAPKDGTFLLLACPSGYTTTPFVFTTGRQCPDYKVGRWIDHANDDLTDWGMVPTHWKLPPSDPTQGGN